MPATAPRGKEATLNLRIDIQLKSDFASAAEAENRPVAEVLRGLMRSYVEEARRQSQLIAGSEDESEVMRWIQDVSAADGSK